MKKNLILFIMVMMAIEAFALPKPVWIFGKETYSKGYVTSSFILSGTVYYDPDTYTFTLTDAVINYKSDSSKPLFYDGNYGVDMKIKINGECKVTSDKQFAYSSNINIEGDGLDDKLTVDITNENCIIWSNSDVTISNCDMVGTTASTNAIVSTSLYKSRPDAHVYLNHCKLSVSSTESAIHYFDDIVYNQTKMVTPDPRSITKIINNSDFVDRTTYKPFPKYEFDIATEDDHIVFLDSETEKISVAKWDTNKDGGLSYAEAAAITTLGDAFTGNTTIKSFKEIKYFTGLTEINANAFANCSNLTDISIPAKVRIIGENAFAGTTNLGDVLAEDNSELYMIGVGAFKNSGIKHLNKADNIEFIRNEAFMNCDHLYSLTMPSTLKTIATRAFYNCTSLNILLPRSVSSISGYAFYGCKNMKQAQYLGSDDVKLTIADHAFRNSAVPNITICTTSFSFTSSFYSGTPSNFICYIDHSIYHSAVEYYAKTWPEEEVKQMKPFSLIYEGNNYRQFCFDKDVIVRQDNATPLIITKYREANENDGYLYYVELPDNIVPANTPVLLRCASKNKAAYFDIIEPGTLNVQPVKVVNYLIGSLTGTVAPASTETENRFLWKDNKFNPIKSASSRFNNVDAGSVYMQLPQLKYPDASYIVYTIDPTGGTPLAKPGDVDSNGVINVSDVTALINKILGTADYATSLCDVDANGTINVSDVTALINMILASAE